MASSSSSVHIKSYPYDVFLSFSGEDTRKTFIDHLYAALDQHGIRTFKDDERLEKGKKISDDLFQSIEDSRLYIIVFSKNYASSSWCLNELLKIMECHNTNERLAFPVFYDVEPSEVRKQSGFVGEALAKQTDKNKSELGKWREALKEAADLSGWDVRKTANGHEAKVIKLIVERVSLELRSINTGIDENLVGMEQRMQALDPYLDIDADDVRMVGIKGMGGAGKTTLAQAIFDKISINFEGRSFVENVREKASKFGLEKLQEQVLRDVLKGNDINVNSVHEGRNLIKTMLCGKKILVVLDDVDHRDQLEALAGYPNWFKLGSRIIITTRDKQVLIAHKVKCIHDVNLLSNEEAILLFHRHAFGEDIRTKEYEMQSLEVVRYAAGLPLTIKVLGSFLCGKNKSEWIDALARLKTIPLEETLKKLELSYESLEDDYKEIFLDVACFLKDWKEDDAIRWLESCGFCAKNGLRVLQQKSLIVIEKGDDGTTIDMHDHLVEMGKNLVRREHPDEPNKHSRLWIQEEIKHVLAGNLGSEATRCADLRITLGINSKGLGNMKKLRCLIVKHEEYDFSHGRMKNLLYIFERSLKYDKACRYFPTSLQYLHWYEYPYWCLPKTFEATNLVALEMRWSKIKQLWKGRKVIETLRFLDLSCSSKLRSLDLGLTPNLERLNLESCSYLVKLDVPSGCLKRLVFLNLHNCNRLKSVYFIKELESLQVLDIGWLNLKKFPEYITTGHLINSLQELNLSRNRDIVEVPSSIGNLRKLVSLNLSMHLNLKSVPGSICSLQHLTTLNLSNTGIEELPKDIGQLKYLKYLYLYSTNVRYLPGSICMLKSLKTLQLSWCFYLEKIPKDIGQLESLEELHLFFCTNLREIPNTICMLKHLKTLDLSGCKLLEKLPEDVGQLESLKILHLKWCSNLSEIPNSICKLKCLEELSLEECERVEKLPDKIGDLKALQFLDVRDTCITQLPQSLSLLKGLRIRTSKPYTLEEEEVAEGN